MGPWWWWCLLVVEAVLERWADPMEEMELDDTALRVIPPAPNCPLEEDPSRASPRADSMAELGSVGETPDSASSTTWTPPERVCRSRQGRATWWWGSPPSEGRLAAAEWE